MSVTERGAAAAESFVAPGSPGVDPEKRRCSVCKRHPEECVCGQIPRAQARTHVVFLQHARERLSQSNTGLLAHRILAGSQLITIGSLDNPREFSALDSPERDLLVLYPRADAEVLTTAHGSPGRAMGLVVLDATWPQARRMTRRVQPLFAKRYVQLPPGLVARWQMRKMHRTGRLGTAEALAWALEILGDTEAADAIRAGLELVASKIYSIRGKTHPDDEPTSERP